MYAGADEFLKFQIGTYIPFGRFFDILTSHYIIRGSCTFAYGSPLVVMAVVSLDRDVTEQVVHRLGKSSLWHSLS